MKTETIISKNDIISAMAYCAIRQSPYDFPLNLKEALTALSETIDSKGIFKSPEKKTTGAYLKVNRNELKALIKDLIFGIPEIAIWNITKIEQDAGITDPNDEKRTVKYAFVDRYSGPPQDRDFIDLDALRQNVFGMIMN